MNVDIPPWYTTMQISLQHQSCTSQGSWWNLEASYGQCHLLVSFKTWIFSQVFWRTWDKMGRLDWNMAIWIAVVGSTPLSLARNTQVDFLLITTQNIPHFPTHTCAKSKESKAENDAYRLQPKPPQKSLMLHVVRQSSGQRWLCSPHWTVLGWRRGAYTCHHSS